MVEFASAVEFSAWLGVAPDRLQNRSSFLASVAMLSVAGELVVGWRTAALK